MFWDHDPCDGVKLHEYYIIHYWFIKNIISNKKSKGKPIKDFLRIYFPVWKRGKKCFLLFHGGALIGFDLWLNSFVDKYNLWWIFSDLWTAQKWQWEFHFLSSAELSHHSCWKLDGKSLKDEKEYNGTIPFLQTCIKKSRQRRSVYCNSLFFSIIIFLKY